jgi:hypothetical protein
MNTLTNLLPQERIRAASREYWLRLATLVVSGGTLLVLIHAVLLLPSFIYLSEEAKTHAAHLEGIDSSYASSEGQEIGSRIEAMTLRADALGALTKSPSATLVVKSVLAVPRGGVRIRSLTLSLPENGSGQMRMSGIAPTRESLQQYHAALQDLPFVTKADLPLSVYAEERNLPFIITLTGSFRP